MNWNLKNSGIKELSKSVDALTDASETKLIKFSNSRKNYIMASEKITDYNRWNGEAIVSDSLYIVTIIPTNDIRRIKNRMNSEINTLSKKTIAYTIVLSLIFAVISIVATVFYTVQKTKQIRLIWKGLDQISDQNYDISIEVISKDELGNLAKTFNKISKEIAQTHKQLEIHALELEEKVKERTMHLEIANQKLEELIQIDGLTKINNRRYFDTVLTQKWGEYAKLKQPISIIMIDIDQFKKYNDYYGHQEGDACLCLVASTLEKQINRSRDIIARYGGEEFVVITCVGLEKAYAIAEKMRLAISSLAIEHKAVERGIVTVSLGVSSTIPSGEREAKELVKASDIALYKSKKNGRNMVSVATESPLEMD